MANYFSQVSDPISIPIRPLDKGMILNRPSQAIPADACRDAQNYLITESGPRRRPGVEPYGLGGSSYEVLTQTAYRHIDLFTLWTSGVGDIAQELLLITAGPLYKVGIGGLEEVEWAYSTGTVTVAGNVVTGLGTAFEDEDIYPGDIVRVGTQEARIDEIQSNTGITLEGDGLIDPVVGATYSIVRSFNVEPEHLCDWAVVNNEVVFADFNKPLVVYKYGEPVGSQMELYIQDDAHKIDNGSGPEDFVAGTIAYFQNRVFVGYTLEGTDGLRRHRVRWSKATNTRDFSESTAWLDLPYTQGAIRRLQTLGNTLVAYCDDAIFIGMPTNNPFLPVTFQRIDTGSIGLVGMKALAGFVNGHFYVGQDDIYFLTTRGPERIGSPVVKATIQQCDFRERIYVANDPENDRVVFGFPSSQAIMEKLWSFNYKTKAWSYDAIRTYMTANPLASLDLDWGDLVGFTWSEDNPLGGTYPTWDSMASQENTRDLFLERNGAIRKFSKSAAQDSYYDIDGVRTYEPIEAVYETGDFDYEEPDSIKTFLRVGMKIDFETTPSSNVIFIVQGSHNRGRSWTALGNLVITPDADEGYVNFLMTSSHVRFRVTTLAPIAPFTISEIVVKVRKRGPESHGGWQE